jgi:hypothetical protein
MDGPWWPSKEGSRTDRKSRERGPFGPGSFSIRREESGSFYSSAHRHRYCDTAPGLRFGAVLILLIPSLSPTFRNMGRLHSKPWYIGARLCSYVAVSALANHPHNCHGRCPSPLFCPFIEPPPTSSPRHFWCNSAAPQFVDVAPQSIRGIRSTSP